jgi:hypothetical protein
MTDKLQVNVTNHHFHKTYELDNDEPFVFDHIDDLKLVDGIIKVLNTSNA